MSDTPSPTPETRSASSTPPASHPKRPWTILGRLAKAVREQNWFAVVLELAIVVLGVVIGFQVTAWGQARADRAQEQVYLRQLATDLAETERLMTDIDAYAVPFDRAGSRLVQSYYQIEPPPADSLTRWLSLVYKGGVVRPVVGTTEALVATGDLNLIRSDSLRAAVTAYLEDMRDLTQSQETMAGEWSTAVSRLHEQFDPVAVQMAGRPTSELDSLARVDDLFWLPPSPRRAPPPVDVETLLRSPGVRARLWEMNHAKRDLRRIRSQTRESSETLRRRVEAELNR